MYLSTGENCQIFGFITLNDESEKEQKVLDRKKTKRTEKRDQTEINSKEVLPYSLQEVLLPSSSGVKRA